MKNNTKNALDFKHQPELGACPCMRVGGFKRNPIGFSSGETGHKRRQTLKKDLRVAQQLLKGTFLQSLHLSNQRARYHSNPYRASGVAIQLLCSNMAGSRASDLFLPLNLHLGGFISLT